MLYHAVSVDNIDTAHLNAFHAWQQGTLGINTHTIAGQSTNLQNPYRQARYG
jgi:hypothetical protein